MSASIIKSYTFELKFLSGLLFGCVIEDIFGGESYIHMGCYFCVSPMFFHICCLRYTSRDHFLRYVLRVSVPTIPILHKYNKKEVNISMLITL